jgi:hypothetical protein
MTGDSRTWPSLPGHLHGHHAKLNNLQQINSMGQRSVPKPSGWTPWREVSCCSLLGGNVATKLIELNDGILVEVQAQEGGYEALSSRLADRVTTSIDGIGALASKLCKQVGDSLKDLKHDVEIEHVEVALNLGFEAEGNIYIARLGADANVSVTFTIRQDRGNGAES